MSMAAGAVLRSLATKMGSAPPRLPYALERHGRLPTSSGGLGLSGRFSTSTSGSMPPSGSLRGPQSHNKKVHSGSGWHRAILVFNDVASIASFFMLGSIAYMHFTVSPSMDRMDAKMDAEHQRWVTFREDIKKIRERRLAASLPNNKESQTEATDVSDGKRITGICTRMENL